ncbi:MAG: TorF family putative porin, partial [Gemmatimonadota bacterium]
MKIRKVSAVAAAIVGALVVPAAVSAQAEVTGNAGYVSQYYYRGIPQKNSSASAGLDVAASNFSAGTWAADVGDGSEVDLYAAVDIPVSDMVGVSVGGTGYFYTGDFDVTYLEGNLGVALGPVSIEWSLGSHQYDPDAAKYSFLGLTVEQNGLFATVGSFSESSEFSDAIGDMFTLKAEDLPATAGIHGQ